MYFFIYYADYISINKKMKEPFSRLSEEVIKAYKLSDIPEEIFDSISEEEIEKIYYFFFDLETL